MATVSEGTEDRPSEEIDNTSYVNDSIFKSFHVGETFRVRRGSVDSVGAQRDGEEVVREMRIRRQRGIRRKVSRTDLESDVGYLTVREIVHTERNYVIRLQLLDELRSRNNTVRAVSDEVIKKILPNLPSILMFHRDYLLPQLEARLLKWTALGGRIGDVFRQCQPQLRQYSDYMLGLREASKLMGEWSKKSTKFSNIINEIEKKPESQNMKLENHLLEPVQRLPRYQLLLERYVKHLPDTSADLEDAKASVAMIKKVADYADDVLFRSDNHESTLRAYRRIRGEFSESVKRRVLVKEGKVMCLDSTSEMTFNPYLFLFTDVLLMCDQTNKDKYTLRKEIPVSEIEVRPGKGEHKNRFLLMCRDNACLVCDTPDVGGSSWYQEVRKLVDREEGRRTEREVSAQCIQEEDTNIYFRLPAKWLGKWKPRMLDVEVTESCLSCFMGFHSTDSKRQCTTCSLVICSGCSRSAMVEYLEEEAAVCLECFHILNKSAS